MKSDAQRGLHHAARRTVGTLPKRRKPEGRSRSGDRGELPHAATEEFAKSYQINLRLLPELAFSSEHDETFRLRPLRHTVDQHLELGLEFLKALPLAVGLGVGHQTFQPVDLVNQLVSLG